MGNRICFRKSDEDYYLLDANNQKNSKTKNSYKAMDSEWNYRFSRVSKKSPIIVDVVGVVISFVKSSGVFFKIISLNKLIRSYVIKTNPVCARNVVFKVTSNSALTKPRKFYPYVFRLNLDLTMKFKDTYLKLFPNLEKIRIWQCNSFRCCEVIKHLHGVNLKSIEIIDNKTMTDSFIIKQTNSLVHLKIDNCEKISDVGICVLNNLKKLHLHRGGKLITHSSFSHLTKLEDLGLHNMSFVDLKVNLTTGTGLTRLCLEHFEIKDCIFDQLVNLQKLKLKYCDKVQGKNFGVLTKLRVLKLYWCDNIIENAVLPKSLVRISLKGIGDYTGETLKDCVLLQRISLCELPMLTEDCFSVLNSLKRLKVVECNKLTPKFFEMLPKIDCGLSVKVRNCNQISCEVYKQYLNKR